MASTPALEIKGLQAWYGESHVLHGVDLVVQPGEVVTLLGRNGAGRTSTMRAIMGLIGSRKGSVKINGQETIGLPTHRIAHLGVGYCPEERGIFSSLSCEENLLLPPMLKTGHAGMSLEQIYAMFPNLAERKNSQGTRLSGGEQQMLAVARILRTGAIRPAAPSIKASVVSCFFMRVSLLKTENKSVCSKGKSGVQTPRSSLSTGIFSSSSAAPNCKAIAPCSMT